ncbi:hypothetical protein ACFQY4_28255 [Catellatospora bangladeshensis]|uniref:hypothetical protein n=1 Tax=Catellatospora bangladeshensis TaxID=310355 RepID=UPI0036148049
MRPDANACRIQRTSSTAPSTIRPGATNRNCRRLLYSVECAPMISASGTRMYAPTSSSRPSTPVRRTSATAPATTAAAVSATTGSGEPITSHQGA